MGDSKLPRAHKDLHNEHIEQLRLQDILDMQHIHELNDAFAYAMGLASTVVDLQGNPIAGPSNHSRLCQIIRSTAQGLANCMYSARIMGQKAHLYKRPYSSPCLGIGFVDAAAPIIVQDRHIATWLVGQAYLADVDALRVKEYALQIGADEKEMLEAFLAMSSIAQEAFKIKLDLLWRVAQNVSTLGFNNLRYSIALEQLQHSQAELENYRQYLEVIVQKRTQELQDALAKVEKLSMTDHLTGCFNRQYLHQHLEHELKRSQRYNRSFSVVICDIDHFKKVNDFYGHQCGDHVLFEFARTIKSCIRVDIDWLVRYGGEEFILILPETDFRMAETIAERLRKAIEGSVFNWQNEKIRITTSLGLVSYEAFSSGSNPGSDDLIMVADQNLYQAKAKGRNTVYGTKA